jgi:hypothetical protein
MPFLAEHMKALVDDIRLSRTERAEAAADLRRCTDDVLSETRSFMARVHRDQRAMAGNLRSMLTSHQQRTSTQVRTMQQEHFRQRSAVSRATQTMLGNARKARQERVHQLRAAFQQAQHDVAEDLHQAARLWRECASR